MPLLEKGLSNVPGIKSITSKKVTAPTYVADDFSAGFLILEFENGERRNGSGTVAGTEDVVLNGPFMPHQPFTFGGTQRLNKTYYAGNPEPTVNVLGAQEDNLTIKGRLKLKQFKRVTVTKRNDKGEQSQEEANVRSIAVQYQELIDGIRRRGNLVQLIMGEWQRWAFIEKVTFDLNTVADISYSIEFFVVGFEKPRNTRLVGGYDDNIKKPNADLISATQTAIAAMRKYPENMPQSISDFLDGEISTVASIIGTVTGAVDEALTDLENINQSANRALGLIGNARASISKSLRRVNQLSTSVTTLGSRVADQAQKTVATVKSVRRIGDMKAQYSAILANLASIQLQILALRKTVPLRRHLVVQGETLQKISNKYYGNPDQWTAIYDHNKLQSTLLTVGTVIEIPKV